MAIDQGTETIAVTSEERTWRVNIETPKGGDPVVTVWRETVRTGQDGAVLSRETVASVERALSKVADQMFDVGKSVCSVGEIAETIAVIADTWRQEDIDAGKVG